MAFHSLTSRIPKGATTYFRILVSVTGGLILLAASLAGSESLFHNPGMAFIVLLFSLLLTLFPLRLLQSDFYFLHGVALGGGLLYGAVPTGWAIALGVLAGILVRQRWPHPANPGGRFSASTAGRFSSAALWLEAGPVIGRHLLAVFVALFATGLQGGLADRAGSPAPVASLLAPLALFAGVHGALYLTEYFIRQPEAYQTMRSEMVTLALIEMLPLPFIFLAVAGYPSIGLGALVALGGLPLIVSILLYRMFATRAHLERHVQELSTLYQVSQVMRSTLDMEQLLSVIHVQVSRILEVDNFYVALYDAHKERIWYPLAVKQGIRQNWATRGLEDRLTDRIIRERRPLVINSNPGGASTLDLAPSEVTPSAWIGVPLISSDRAIGCLALFSISPETNFTSADLDLLVTLSGPISVSIENALLFDQVQRRAAQMETLNGITALITASLDPQEVLQKVCLSLDLVVSGARSAIFLLDPGENQIWLAHAHGLSPEFVEQNSSFAVMQNGRTRCMRTGRPVLSPDIRQLTLENEYRASLHAEKIIAAGDFPMSTPEGQIGFLSVYFDQAHAFAGEEVELLQTFAAQAALAVSNARLHARTDLALSQRANQLSMLESVGRELAAAMNSERLFEMISTYAREFTNSPWGSLSLYNPQTNSLQIKAAAGYSVNRSSYPVEQGIGGRAVRMRQALIVGDVRQDPDYIDLTDCQARSQLSVPVLHEGRVLGVLSLEKAQLNGYSTSDLAFITQLANQAAVAVVNAELFSETQRRLREQSTLYLISTSLASKLDLEGVIEIIQRTLAATWQDAVSGVYLWHENECRYLLQPSANVPALPGRRMHLPDLLTEEAVKGLGLERPGVERVNSGPLCYLKGTPAPQALKQHCQDCQVIVLPLSSQEHRLGFVLLHLPASQAIQPADDLQLLGAIAAQATLSLQNALLFSAISQGRNRLAAVLNSVREGIVMIEAGGGITIVNESVRHITGCLPEDFMGRRLPELAAQTLRTLGYTLSEAQDLADALVQGSVPAYPKLTFHLKDSPSERVIERISLPVWGSSGSLIGWMIILRDVSEEHQVVQARELITETLVHDLRSPLSAVLGALDVMDEALYGQIQADELTAQALQVARRGAKRVLGLVESLLDISRMQSGSMEMTFLPLDLPALVNTILNEYIPQANEFGVILRDELPSPLPLVCADSSKLSRVLINLLDNALKFTPSGGQVIFSAAMLPEGMLQVNVCDSGPGIPEEFREKIFERFTQVPGLRGRRRGSGLGLTFCKLAVEAHGGHIWVAPRPGGGSMFSFTLPAAGPIETLPVG